MKKCCDGKCGREGKHTITVGGVEYVFCEKCYEWHTNYGARAVKAVR
jgi:hypothetical protein